MPATTDHVLESVEEHHVVLWMLSELAGLEDQLGALGLVLNAIVLRTTKYIDAAVAQLKAEGHELRDEDIARLSPLKHSNLNVLGRYSFTASAPAAGALRPLRDPDAAVLDDDDDGAAD